MTNKLTKDQLMCLYRELLTVIMRLFWGKAERDGGGLEGEIALLALKTGTSAVWKSLEAG